VALVLCANNIKVSLSYCQVPTPIVSYYTKYSRMDLGIMITASHNPYYFNGFKIKTPEGGAADNTITAQVEKLLRKTSRRYYPSKKLKKAAC